MNSNVAFVSNVVALSGNSGECGQSGVLFVFALQDTTIARHVLKTSDDGKFSVDATSYATFGNFSKNLKDIEKACITDSGNMLLIKFKDDNDCIIWKHDGSSAKLNLENCFGSRFVVRGNKLYYHSETGFQCHVLYSDPTAVTAIVSPP